MTWTRCWPKYGGWPINTAGPFGDGSARVGRVQPVGQPVSLNLWRPCALFVHGYRSNGSVVGVWAFDFFLARPKASYTFDFVTGQIA